MRDQMIAERETFIFQMSSKLVPNMLAKVLLVLVISILRQRTGKAQAAKQQED